MPIEHPSAPAGGAAILSHVVRDILAAPSPAALRAFGSVPPHQLSLSGPHRCYIVALADLVNGDLLSGAQCSTWRYLIVSDAGAIADAELLDRGPIGLEFVSIGYGAMAHSTITALKVAESLPQIQHAVYEVRCLKVPAINFVAMWFHGTDDDILIPMEPTTHPSLARPSPYTENQLLNILKPEAMRAKQAYDADTTGNLGG